jgi:hypothetical protein
MKTFRLLFTLLTFSFLFSACQKDLNPEYGIATGTLAKDAAGDCAPITVNGNYEKNVLLNGNNYVDVQVNFTNVGNYKITSDTVNGYSFKAAGVVGLTGNTTIRLQGTGKPLFGGTDVFKIRFDSTGASTCEVNITVAGASAGPAIFTLGATSGACTGFVLGTGSYNPGVAMGDTNTVTLNVNVTQVGTYNITTTSTTANGIVFTGTGNLPNLGSATIKLTAQGIPTNTVAAVGTYNVTVGTSTCSFNISFNAPPPPATYTVTCASTVVNAAGVFQAGTAFTANEKVTLSVNATTAGSYNIATNNQNGVVFQAAGNLVVGTNTVVLKAASPNNIPTAAGLFTYSFSNNGGATCTFPITYIAAPVSFITANVSGVPITFNVDAKAILSNSFGNTVTISGRNNSTAIEKMTFSVSTTAAPAAGTYSVALTTAIVNGNYTTATGIPFEAVTGIPGGTFTVVITSINATRVKGSFFGEVKENVGFGPNAKMITNGLFDVAF